MTQHGNGRAMIRDSKTFWLAAYRYRRRSVFSCAATVLERPRSVRGAGPFVELLPES